MLTILWSFSTWSKLERWKTSINKWLVSWLKIKKKSSFWNVIFSYCMQQQQIIHFSINLWHTTKSGFYMQLGDDQLCGWTEKRLQSLPKAKNFHQKKVMVVAWWSAACLIHYSFLNPGKTLHLRSALSKLRCTENDTQAVGTGQQYGPNSSPQEHLTAQHITNVLKVEWIGLQSFVSSTIITWPLANRLPLPEVSRQLFAAKMLPSTIRRQKMLSKNSLNPKAQIVMLQG